MSDDEKHRAQGRAYAELKEHKSNVATLTVALREYSTTLKELGQQIDALLMDPGRGSPGATKPQFANLQDHLRKIEGDTSRAALQLEEIYMEASNARQLQEETDKF